MATTTQTKTQDTNQQKVSSRDKQLFPPLKVNVLTMCEDLLEIHDRMKEDLQQIKTTGNTDEKLKFLTRAILEMREVGVLNCDVIKMVKSSIGRLIKDKLGKSLLMIRTPSTRHSHIVYS
eukprot:TRINITY_DN2305_c0_g1_i1.p1 TRINITY_DN2305_c0_g1~~TRINITY_DN2305_c0_g1_i1.p1  ORF type:complete len:120 (-),score=18.84 TRINITY_DN2305_c0_g1_i1:29-388(-)